MPDAPPIYYCVIDVASGAKLYRGQSLDAAAKALRPGTVVGRGTTQCGATLEAQQQARKLRRGDIRHSSFVIRHSCFVIPSPLTSDP